MADYSCGHIRCEPYGTCQFDPGPDLLAELDEAERVMSQCGVRHDTADLTGLACELPEEHAGDHQGWVPVTWPREDADE